MGYETTKRTKREIVKALLEAPNESIEQDTKTMQSHNYYQVERRMRRLSAWNPAIANLLVIGAGRDCIVSFPVLKSTGFSIGFFSITKTPR